MSSNSLTPCNVLWYNQLGMNDVDRVGGKNASLGEMITNLAELGVSVMDLPPQRKRLMIFWNKVVLISVFMSYSIVLMLMMLIN